MVTFILFPGFGGSKYQWDHKIIFKDNHFTIEECDFLDKLKKLGNVFTYTPKWNNGHKYDKTDELQQFYDPDMNINFDYLNLEKHCQMIHNEIENTFQPPYIILGHSIGAYFAYKFAELYKAKCLATFILDGTPIFKKYIKDISPFLSNPKLTKLVKNVTNDDFIDIIKKIQKLYKEDKDVWSEMGKFVQIVLYHLEKQYKSINPKFSTKTFLLSDLSIGGDNDKDMINKMKGNINRINNNDDLKKINGDLVKIYYFINKTHDLQCGAPDDVIQIITDFLNTIEKQHGGYYDKYMKYKYKYLELKNQNGGSHNLIIHISGASGSGKTTLGNKLKDKFGNKITVKDIDDLRGEFIDKYYKNKSLTTINKTAYQEFIDEYINKQKKPLILVGLNNMPWWHKDLYYNMHSQYNYYIDIDDMTVIKQKCLRSLEGLSGISSDKVAMDDLINHNDKFVKLTKEYIDRECSAKNTIQMNKKWNHDYKQQGYKFMSREEIFNEVSKIIAKA